jgi:hypothetical protein
MKTIIQHHKFLIIIILFGLAARIGAALYFGNRVEALPGTFDQISYHKLALRLVDGHGFTFGQIWWPKTAAGEPTAHWSYLYTVYLAGIYKLLGPVPIVARLLQVLVVGILQPYLAYLIGRHVFSEAVGLVGAALTVVYSYFIYYSTTLMTESFYITAILAGLFLTIRLAEAEDQKEQFRLALGLGLIFGITVLLRQLFMLIIPLFLLWLVGARYRRFGRLSIRPVLVSSIVVAIMILPFTVFNYLRFDRLVLLNTNAGYAFYWANHPIYGNQFEPILSPERGTYPDLIPEELRHLDEAALDQALLRLGLATVLDDPVRYIRLSLSRIPIYFKFWPSADSGTVSNFARVSSFGVLWPFMLYGLFYAFLRRSKSDVVTSPIFLLLLFAVAYTAIHLLSWSLIRYRLPVDAVLLIFAALPIGILLSKVKFGRFVEVGEWSRSR